MMGNKWERKTIDLPGGGERVIIYCTRDMNPVRPGETPEMALVTDWEANGDLIRESWILLDEDVDPEDVGRE